MKMATRPEKNRQSWTLCLLDIRQSMELWRDLSANYEVVGLFEYQWRQPYVRYYNSNTKAASITGCVQRIVGCEGDSSSIQIRVWVASQLATASDTAEIKWWFASTGIGLAIDNCMASIFAHENVPVLLCPYEMIALTDRGGIMEAISDTISMDSLKRKDLSFVLLANFFETHFRAGDDLLDGKANFVESLAAYSVVLFLIQANQRSPQAMAT
jgi:hypothetical protein